MSDIRIEVTNGYYDTDDSYNKVIGYITNKNLFGGYGFYYSHDISIIEQFKLSEMYSDQKNEQKIWHFFITFSKRWNHMELLELANQIAFSLSPQYQIVYGLDIDKGKPHLHFGINAFSYHPDTTVLTPEYFQGCLVYWQNKLAEWYPHKTVTLQFRGKKES